MKAGIVYDSFFGNTEEIAWAIRDGLAQAGAGVTAEKTGGGISISPSDCDVFIVGSPTRGFQASPKIQAYLRALPRHCLEGKRIAAFDTRMAVEEVGNCLLTMMAGLFGYAAEKIDAGLRQRGGVPVSTAEGFFVEGSEGPLKPGERERAIAWGKRLAG